MKKYIVLLIIAVMTGVVLFGCSKGETGVAGPAGADGTDVITVMFENGVSPSAAYAGIDETSLISGGSAIDFGSCPGTGFGYTTTMGYLKMRAMINVDVSYMIPENVDVISAKLHINVDQKTGNTTTVRAYKVTTSWDEGTQCFATSTNGATWDTTDGTTAWSTAGGDYDAASAGGATSVMTIAEYEIDVKPSVIEGWLADPSSNHGLIVIADDEVNENPAYFVAADVKLEVNYTLP